MTLNGIEYLARSGSGQSSASISSEHHPSAATAIRTGCKESRSEMAGSRMLRADPWHAPSVEVPW